MIHRLYSPKQESPEEAIWLTIYADLVTNMALVFLALYGLTVMGKEALTQAIQSMQKEGPPAPTAAILADFESIGPVLRKEFRGAANVRVIEDVGVVRIEFGETVLFNSGGAVLKNSSQSVIRQVADLLRTLPYTVVVEGHTDSVPVRATGPFKDNWELSLARSLAVANMLIEEGHFSPSQIAAAAYGQQRPRAPNSTVAGRRLNRRVELALFKSNRYKPEGVNVSDGAVAP